MSKSKLLLDVVEDMMTILASYAQEESRSANENQKWRIRRGFERGELVNLRFLFGYKIKKGRLAVDPEKAAVVREVFRRALEGESLTSLAIDLNRRGFTGVLGGKWNSMRIREMLSNEKYLGNALLQKQYRNNHLEKKEIPNRGELPQYYAEGTHEAIIDQATFDAAQRLLAKLRESTPVRSPWKKSAFTSMITCAVCGRKYKRCTCGKRHFWNCPTAVQTDLPSCSTSQIPEKLLYDLAAQILGLTQFDEPVFREKIQSIDALPDKTLVFHFYDGSTVARHWEYTSRAKSWTPEMKEKARQRALAQRRGENGKSGNSHPAHHSAHHALGQKCCGAPASCGLRPRLHLQRGTAHQLRSPGGLLHPLHTVQAGMGVRKGLHR